MADNNGTPTGTPAQGTDPAQGTLPPVGGTTAWPPKAEGAQTTQTAQPTAPDITQLVREREQMQAQLAELNAKAAEADKLRKQIEEIEATKLKEQGEFKQLYEKEAEARKRETQALRREMARAEMKTIALTQGIVDPDLIDLIPTKDLKWNEETGRYDNLRELVESHKQAKPNFYAPPASTAPAPVKPTMGNPTSAPATTEPAKPDVSRMSRQEYDVAKRNYLRSLSTRR